MKNFKYKILLALLLIYSCSTDSEVEDEPIPAFDRGAVMSNYANNIIIPRYADFKIELDKLESSINSFTSDPNVSSYDNLNSQWLEAYKSWQYVEMFNIGKAEEIMYFNIMNTYPVNQDRIKNNINNSNYELNNPNDWSCQGFPGLDYLLHGLSNDKEQVINTYKNNVKYVDYIKAVVSKMVSNTNSVIENWDSYKSDFISSTGTVFFADKIVSLIKLQ